MFTVSKNSFISLTDRLPLLLFLLLLPSRLLRHPLAVLADDPIDPTCKTANEYLDAMFRCRASEFQVSSYCANQPLHELTCNKTNRMAIFNASIGRSSDRLCSQSRFRSSGSVFHGASDRATDCCLLPTVENKCHGRTKCNLHAAELLHSTDAEPCVPRDSRQTEQRIMVVFICVSHKTFRELKRDRTEPDAFCDGQTEAGEGGGGGGGGGGDEEATDTLRRRPVNPGRSEELPTTATAADTPSPHPVPPTADASDPTSPDHREDFETEQSESTAVYRGAGSLDWIWAIIFIRDNMDKFLIYLFLSIAVGIILVLVIVVVGLCFGRCWKKRRHSAGQLTVVCERVTQSSTQTNDVTASLMAATVADRSPLQQGTEMVHYDQTDSFHRRPVTPSSRANGTASSLAGNSVRFAPIDFGQQGVRRTANAAGPTSLNLPQYQINSSSDSTDGDDRVVVERQVGRNDDDDDDDYRSNTLGRFYSNPYRHDSYRADDYRTLQHR